MPALLLILLACEHRSIVRGGEHYAELCATCHGDDGEGYLEERAPMLANADWQALVDENFVVTAVEQGRPETAMGAYGGGRPLAERDVDEVVAFVRDWRTEPRQKLDPDYTAAGDASRGDALFVSLCEECHGVRGQGGSALSLGNPVFLASASDAFLRASIEQGRRDTEMLPWTDQLSEAEVEDLVTLLRSWEP